MTGFLGKTARFYHETAHFYIFKEAFMSKGDFVLRSDAKFNNQVKLLCQVTLERTSGTPLPGAKTRRVFIPLGILSGYGWKITGGRAEHRNAAAVCAITWRALRARNAAALRCSARHGRCRIRIKEKR
jgi:hypothetical protein